MSGGPAAIVDAARRYVVTRRTADEAAGAGYLAALIDQADAFHELVVAVGERCWLCDPGTCTLDPVTTLDKTAQQRRHGDVASGLRCPRCLSTKVRCHDNVHTCYRCGFNGSNEADCIPIDPRQGKYAVDVVDQADRL
jgi:hypothetical protein